jgi:S1-C subfamily serine protease
VLWISNLLSVTDERFKIAIVADGDLLSKRHDEAGGSDDEFNHALASWSTNHNTLAMFIWCFRNGSAQVTYNSMKAQGEDNVLLSSRVKLLSDLESLDRSANEDNPRPRTIVEVLGPDKAEYRNYLNRMRIIGLLSFDMLELDDLAECFFRISRERKLSLADMSIEIRKMPERNITCESVKRHFKVGNIKTGEEQLAELIGMENIKNLIGQLKKRYGNRSVNNEQGFHTRLETVGTQKKMKGEKLHFLLKGNPGTGKTTVAQILGRTLNEIGVLSSGHVVKCASVDFATKYVGDTAKQTAQKVTEALGGVLFVDDIGSFVDGNKSTINEFNGVLLDAMTSYSDLCVIIAGYPDGIEKYKATDAGLPRRFPNEIEMNDYTNEELAIIFRSMAEKKGCSVSDELFELMPTAFKRMREGLSAKKRRAWGNAGVAELLLNDVLRNKDPDVTTLTVDHLPETFKYEGETLRLRGVSEEVKKAPIPKFEAIAGLSAVNSGSVDDVVSEAVISISVDSGNGEGTGFIVSPDGYAITAAHVVAGAGSLRVRLRRRLSFGGTVDVYYKATVLKENSFLDVALLRVSPEDGGDVVRGLPYVTFAGYTNDLYKPLKEVYMLGYPGGASSNDNISTVIGRVLSCQTNAQEFGEICLLDIKGIGGNSGSPVFNERGEVMGVFLGSKIYRGENLTEEINYMRPIKYVRHLFEDDL